MSKALFLPPGRVMKRPSHFPPGYRWNFGSPQARDLIHWYPGSFGRDLTPTLYDNIGGLDLQDGRSNPPDLVVDPEMGKVWRYDGASSEGFEKEDVSAPKWNTNGPWSFTCWFQYNGGVVDGALVAMVDNGATNRYVEMRINNGTDLDIIVRNTTFTALVLSSSINAGEWQLAVGTYGNTATAGRFDVDGYIDDTDTNQGFIDGGSDFSGQLDTLSVGFLGDSSPGEQFTGFIADLKLYNRKLTVREVYHHFHPATRWDLYKQRSLMFPGVDAPAVAGGRIMSSLVGAGGLAGPGGIAGAGGGLAG